jgi:hypothetical protein
LRVGRAKGGWHKQSKYDELRTGIGASLGAWGAEVEAGRTCLSDRLRSAWDRLGPDKFFSPRTKRGKKDARPHPTSPPGEEGASRPMFVRLGISGAKPPSGLLCQSRYKSAPIIVGGGMLKRPLSGQRWDYAGGYAGISGRKIGRFPLNPGYSRVFPHNEFQNFLRALRPGADAQFENKEPMQVVDYLPVNSIFRLISSFLASFLSHKDLVSRRLGMKQGLIEFAGKFAGFESSKDAERIPILHAKQAEPAPIWKGSLRRNLNGNDACRRLIIFCSLT